LNYIDILMGVLRRV